MWHTYSSVFAWETEVISAVFCAMIVWNPCETLVKFLCDSRAILVKIHGDSCGILVKILCMLADCCGVIPPASAHKKSRLESWSRPCGCQRTLAPQRFTMISSDNYKLPEVISKVIPAKTSENWRHFLASQWDYLWIPSVSLCFVWFTFVLIRQPMRKLEFTKGRIGVLAYYPTITREQPFIRSHVNA